MWKLNPLVIFIILLHISPLNAFTLSQKASSWSPWHDASPLLSELFLKKLSLIWSCNVSAQEPLIFLFSMGLPFMPYLSGDLKWNQLLKMEWHLLPFSNISCYTPQSSTPFIGTRLTVPWACRSPWCFLASLYSLIQYLPHIIEKTATCSSKPLKILSPTSKSVICLCC